jgi:hypothetical protein
VMATHCECPPSPSNRDQRRRTPGASPSRSSGTDGTNVDVNSNNRRAHKRLGKLEARDKGDIDQIARGISCAYRKPRARQQPHRTLNERCLLDTRRSRGNTWRIRRPTRSVHKSGSSPLKSTSPTLVSPRILRV